MYVRKLPIYYPFSSFGEVVRTLHVEWNAGARSQGDPLELREGLTLGSHSSFAVGSL